MEPRQVFAKQQDTASAEIELFEIVSIAGAIGYSMLEPCLRHYKRAKTGPPRPQTKISIFIVDKKALIEAADALQQRAPNQ